MPDAPDSPPPDEFTDSPTYHGSVGLVSGLIAFALGSISSAAGTWPVAGLAALFGVQSLYYLRYALFPELRVRLTEQGIELGSRTGSPLSIEWSEVLDVSRSRFGRVEIKVRDGSDVWRRLPRWGRWRREHFSLRPGPITLHGWRLTPDTESIFRALEDGMDQYALRSMKAQAALPAPPPDDPGSAPK
jgi:hypothetical protein